MKSFGKHTKILFAPHEIGGQMQLMVEELRRRGYSATAVSYSQDWMAYVNDIQINFNQFPSRLKRQFHKMFFTIWAANNYDVFHFFWGQSLFGVFRWPHIDLPFLRRMGKKIFVHFRGLDIVDLAYFDYLRARTAGNDVTEPPMSRPDQLRSLAQWRRYADRLLVSEPDLFRVVPDAIMIQQAIDLEFWRPKLPAPPSHEDGIIRVLHAPTMRRKKGTEFVEKSVADLKAAGYPVELVLVENVPASAVKSTYELADVAIDQLLYGWHGKFSAELMALGKPVICYIDLELRSYRPDIPIVTANPKNLTAKLRELLKNPQRRLDLGIRGQEYVKKNHDVRVIIDKCLAIYQEAF